jgi:hypothetical protein
VPACVIPATYTDAKAIANILNAKSGSRRPPITVEGVTKPSRYEPGINRTYQDLADHYGCVVLPTRIIKPRDKAKVEVAVQIVERFVLAKLRNQRFFSLAELNTAIRECVATINAKVMKAFGQSRTEMLETIDRPALGALNNPEAKKHRNRHQVQRCQEKHDVTPGHPMWSKARRQNSAEPVFTATVAAPEPRALWALGFKHE